MCDCLVLGHLGLSSKEHVSRGEIIVRQINASKKLSALLTETT